MILISIINYQLSIINYQLSIINYHGRRIGTAVKEIIDKINLHINFKQYDKFDPCDFDTDGNRREPDGTVDFIFIIFRFMISHVTDPICDFLPCPYPSYTGIAGLGGRYGVFGISGDSSSITRDSVKISALYPGSGCISKMYFKWMINVPAHEFAFHYGYSGSHTDGLGNHYLNG